MKSVGQAAFAMVVEVERQFTADGLARLFTAPASMSLKYDVRVSAAPVVIGSIFPSPFKTLLHSLMYSCDLRVPASWHRSESKQPLSRMKSNWLSEYLPDMVVTS